MVIKQKFLSFLPRFYIRYGSVNLAYTVIIIALFSEMIIRLVYFISLLRGLFTSQLTAEIPVLKPDKKLIVAVERILKPIIESFIENRCACSERNTAVFIRE